MIARWLTGIATILATFAVSAEIIDIDNSELARLAAKGVPIIDIRTAGEWKTGVIPGSRLLTFFDEAGQSNPPQWLEHAKAVAKPDQPVVLVCRSGSRSRRASEFLSTQAGYGTVYNLSKGMNGWAAESRPVTAPAPGMTLCSPPTHC